MGKRLEVHRNPHRFIRLWDVRLCGFWVDLECDGVWLLMPAPDKIKQLVETFEQNLNEYHTRKTLQEKGSD